MKFKHFIGILAVIALTAPALGSTERCCCIDDHGGPPASVQADEAIGRVAGYTDFAARRGDLDSRMVGGPAREGYRPVCRLRWVPRYDGRLGSGTRRQNQQPPLPRRRDRRRVGGTRGQYPGPNTRRRLHGLPRRALDSNAIVTFLSSQTAVSGIKRLYSILHN